MKNQKVTYVKNDEDTTMTLKILVGETFEDTIVTEKLSIDSESGEEYKHFTLETPSTEDQVIRTLEELAADTEAELNEVPSDPTDEDTQLLDAIVIGDPESDALELELMKDE